MALNDPVVLLRRTTNVLELEGLHDTTSGLYPDDADIVITLKLDGVALLGATDLPMTFVGGTVKPFTLYRALVPHTVDLSAAGVYTAVATIDRAGARRELNADVTVIDG